MIEKNIVDRVPTYAGRIKLTPVNGQFDLFTMERADEPVEEGTPIDKSTLDSIIKSRLTGRYYKPTVEKTIFDNIKLTTNPIPKSGWVNVTSTGATNGEYEIIASGSGGAFYPYEAFDGNESTQWLSNAQTGTAELFITVKLSTPVTVTKIKARVSVTAVQSQNYTISGSNDNRTWSVVGTFGAAADGYLIERTMSNPGEYLYYKLSCTGAQFAVRELELSEYTVNTFSNDYIISEGVPLEWDVGQRITIKVPTEANTMGIVSNTLNGVIVNTILQPSKKYELVYNGSTFDAKEV